MKSNPTTILISAHDEEAIMSGKYNDAVKVVEAALKKKVNGEVLLPDKISVVFDEATQNRGAGRGGDAHRGVAAGLYQR